MQILLTILSYVAYILSIIISLILIVVVYLLIEQQIVLRSNPSADVKRRFVYRFAKFILFLTRVEVEVEGRENLPDDAGFLMVPNHQSNFDPFVLQMMNVLTAYVGKIELKDKPVVHPMFLITEGLYLNRKDIRESVRTIGEATKRLKSGINFVIFPEGTRSKGKEMLPFKAGSLKIATKAKAPIVPITHTNTYMISKNFPKKTKTKVIIGKPIYADYYETVKETQLIKEIQETIQNNLNKN